MKRAYFLLGLLALGCLCSPGSCFLFHLFEEPAPEREFPTVDLLVDPMVFPESWYSCGGPAPIPERERGETESFYLAFCHAGLKPGIAGAWHRVFRYRNQSRASASFGSHGFLERHLIKPWRPPVGSSYSSPVADRFRFACAEVDIVGVPYARCQGGKGPLLGAVLRSEENLAGCEGGKRARTVGRCCGLGWGHPAACAVGACPRFVQWPAGAPKGAGKGTPAGAADGEPPLVVRSGGIAVGQGARGARRERRWTRRVARQLVCE